MKAKWIGLLLLIVVALGAVGYVWFSQSTQVTEITGYVGGEKIGLLEDEQVQKILGHSQIGTTMQYAIVNQNNVKTSHQKFIA